MDEVHPVIEGLVLEVTGPGGQVDIVGHAILNHEGEKSVLLESAIWFRTLPGILRGVEFVEGPAAAVAGPAPCAEQPAEGEGGDEFIEVAVHGVEIPEVHVIILAVEAAVLLHHGVEVAQEAGLFHGGDIQPGEVI